MMRGGSDLLEDSPALLKEKLYRLQVENENLRKRQTSADADAYKGWIECLSRFGIAFALGLLKCMCLFS